MTTPQDQDQDQDHNHIDECRTELQKVTLHDSTNQDWDADFLREANEYYKSFSAYPHNDHSKCCGSSRNELGQGPMDVDLYLEFYGNNPDNINHIHPSRIPYIPPEVMSKKPVLLKDVCGYSPTLPDLPDFLNSISISKKKEANLAPIMSKTGSG